MTSIVVWKNSEAEPQSIWAVGDTRVTSEERRVIERAPKILVLDIACARPGTDGFLTEEYWRHSLGFAYSGNTLIGQSAFIGASSFLDSLAHPTGDAIPSLGQIADLVTSVLMSLRISYYKSQLSWPSISVLLFGYCHVEGRLKVIKLLGDHDGPGTQAATQDLKAPDTTVIIGSSTSEVDDQIRAHRSSCEPFQIDWWRAPVAAVESRIADDSDPNVGGGLQLVIATKRRAQIFQIPRPLEPGRPEATLELFGLDPVSVVGPCVIARPAMALGSQWTHGH